MFRKRLAAISMLFFSTGPAFGSAVDAGRSDTSEAPANLSATFSMLHAVSQYGEGVSQMADQRARSDLVKAYARDMVTSNEAVDAKLQAVAQKHGLSVGPLNTQTEEGKSLLERIRAEEVLLGSLQGDAWDKEYMTLVTNSQQSVVHVLDTAKASAKDQDIQQFLGDLTVTVQNRLRRAQDIMAKIYGDEM